MIFKVHSLLFTLMETSGKVQILSPFLGAEHFHFRFNNIKLPTLEFTSSVSVGMVVSFFRGAEDGLEGVKRRSITLDGFYQVTQATE